MQVGLFLSSLLFFGACKRAATFCGDFAATVGAGVEPVMAALLGRIRISFLLLVCFGLSSQNGFKVDASTSYPRILDPQNQDSVAPNYKRGNNQHQDLVPPNNELDESAPQPRHQHRDSGFQHPFNLLVQEHTKDRAVEGISFPDINNLHQFIETLKSSFLTPGKDLAHFQTARRMMMMNEIAGRRSAKEENVDEEGTKGNKVWSEGLISGYGQRGQDVGHPAVAPSVSVPGPKTSMRRYFPREHKSSNNYGSSSPSYHQADFSNAKTGGDWLKNKFPKKSQYSSTSLHEQVAPHSPNALNGHHVASEKPKGSSIVRFKKPQLQDKVGPSQQGSYGKRAYVKVSRVPIASWLFIPEGQSKQTVQNTAAKDSYNVNLSPSDQKSVNVLVQNPRGGRHHFLRKPVNSRRMFSKLPLNSPLDSLVRHHPTPFSVHRPNLAEQTPDIHNQQSHERLERIPISQKLDSVASRRSYAKPNMNAYWMRAMQPKMAQTNRIYRLPSLQRPTRIFHQGLPVYRGPRKVIPQGKKYGFQSRSSYERTNVAHSRSQYTPRKRVFMRAQSAQEPWIRKQRIKL
ncbi:uncharacterized protein LOC133156893 [Syngnathus typhle]|uniref:uncharacterized protein LOC133156893 n=1 Tax=Syngnathus typhle TaxID=161592 RepID=UPI002A6B7613|nr:uncharacterized protein LOC133156893 [Syngnathus typhle]